MKNALLLLLGVTLACRAEAPAATAKRDVEPPIGRLGQRIGSYLTIEGTRAMTGKTGTRTLIVDTVDGSRLEHTVQMWVDNVSFPVGERCVLKGYETGRWIGTPDSVSQATGEVSQAAWQFQFYFRATSVEQPKTLKLE
jgi:hypothetical protein